MNVILERTDKVKYFTNMRSVVAALGISAAAFDWYISDIETNYRGAEFYAGDQWMSGEELERFLTHNEVQFIWAVFSAVPKGFRSVVKEAPYIDGNPDYWQGIEVVPQLPNALFEIACWDSSATIFVGLPVEALNNLRNIHPSIKLLVTRGSQTPVCQ